MLVYVLFGGMLATTWVQIIKAVALARDRMALSLLVIAHFDFSLGAFLQAAATVRVSGNARTCCSRACSTTGRWARGTSFRSASRSFWAPQAFRTSSCASLRCRRRTRRASRSLGDGARRRLLSHDVVHGAGRSYDRRTRAHRQTDLCGPGDHLYRAPSRTSSRRSTPQLAHDGYIVPVDQQQSRRAACWQGISAGRCSPPSSPPSPLQRFSRSSPA